MRACVRACVRAGVRACACALHYKLNIITACIHTNLKRGSGYNHGRSVVSFFPCLALSTIRQFISVS